LRFEVEQLFDPREAAAGFLRQSPCTSTMRRRPCNTCRLCSWFRGSSRGIAGDGTVLIETEDQELLLQEQL
jgi:hypothetical protein